MKDKAYNVEYLRMLFAKRKPFCPLKFVWSDFYFCKFRTHLLFIYAYTLYTYIYPNCVPSHIQMKAPCIWIRPEPNERNKKKKRCEKNNIICIVVCCVRVRSIRIASCRWSFLWFSFAACWLLYCSTNCEIMNYSLKIIKPSESHRKKCEENQVQGQHNGFCRQKKKITNVKNLLKQIEKTTEKW